MPAGKRKLTLTLLAYLAFVIYGSLVPFEYRSLPLAHALEVFARTPWLPLGPESRADWVANIVLYVPLAFLACAVLASGARTLPGRYLRIVVVLAGCLLVAVGIEFTQLYFAPRTVSLNDLLAEALGSLAGAGLWVLGHARMARLWRDFERGDRRSLAAATAAYLGLYGLLALFPYDFLISPDEIAAKYRSANLGWLFADWGENPVRLLARLIAEGVAIAPLGMLIGVLAARVDLRRTFLAGVTLGIVLEVAQFFLLSGVSQGASALVRGAGLAAGVAIGHGVRLHGLLPLARWIRRLALPALPLYLLGLAAASGWLHLDVLGPDSALAKLATVHPLPFYYHYYTSEPIAMASLLANLALYAPLGLLAWARHRVNPRARRHGLREPALWAAGLALPVEAGKLWLAGAHPDPTNLLIAATGAMLTYALVAWVTRVSDRSGDDGGPAPTPEPRPEREPASATIAHGVGPLDTPTRWRPGIHHVTACVFVILLVLGVAAYPLYAPLLGLLLAAYGLALWYRPWAWLFVIPAALPVLDFAPLTGRLLFDEFDLLMLTSLGVAYWRSMGNPVAPWPGRTYRAGGMLLVASTLIATATGLWAWDGRLAVDASHAPVEALLVAKGLFWALLLLPLLRRVPRSDRERYGKRLLGGLACGLVLLSLAVLWERQVHVGITDTEMDFRVTGTFSSMNNGGAYVEAFIAMAFPALVAWTLGQRALWLRVAGVAGATLASYAMLVTFSRGGYAGLAAGLVVVLFAAWRPPGRRSHQRLLLAGVVVVVIATAVPVLLGGYAQGRLALATKDLQARLAHWEHALSLMAPGGLTLVTGRGFGSYPRLYLWNGIFDRPPGTFGVHREDDSTFLRLGAGDAYYLDQIVNLDSAGGHRLTARIRFSGSAGRLRVPLCRKALLYSFRCDWHELRPPAGAMPGQWHEFDVPLQTSGLGGGWPGSPPKLALAGPGGRGAVDVDRIGLLDREGRERLTNGGFEQGLERWLPATDRDLAWHIHQSALEVLFAQGLLGLGAFLLILIAALKAITPGLRRGAPYAIGVAGGLAGFVVVGLLGSTLDSARMLLLFVLVASGGLLAGPGSAERRSG